MHKPDILDVASELEEKERAAAIQAALNNVTRLPAIGFCHYCEEEVEGNKVFCDHECSADYEHLQKRSRINIRV